MSEISNVQYPPRTSGMKNHVRVRKRWYLWSRVTTAKRIMKRTAAPIEGLYWYAIQPLWEGIVFVCVLSLALESELGARRDSHRNEMYSNEINSRKTSSLPA